MNFSEDPPERSDVQPESTGSSQDQDQGELSQALVQIDKPGQISHVGALLTEHEGSERLFNRAVALAALRDAEASRRFVEEQLTASQADNRTLREELEATKLKVVRLRAAVRAHMPLQLVFGMGAAIFGSSLGGAFTSQFTPLHWIALLVGAALMVLGVVRTGKGERQ